jgi:hypothetical protein
VVVANATQTITTPNAAFISYNLAAGTNSAAITPATNRAVLVMGSCTTTGGVGQVSLQHLLSAPSSTIDWVGLEPSGAGIASGNFSSAGHHIVYIDNALSVDIRTASADTILIHNGSAFTLAGNVTLIW